MTIVAKDKQKPYIITPHGMLEPWVLNYGKWKKKVAMQLFQYKDIENAACLHATSQIEAENIRNLGFKNPIAVIPNGIAISEFTMPEIRKVKAKKTLLFLSRIHPKKGIELLISAWSRVNHSIRRDWQINIAGNGESKYIATLYQLIKDKKLENEIHIIGPQFGANKLKAYHSADLFVLPTFSENFGLVVAEALACGIPVITTKGTPWDELITHDAGWWINMGLEPLVEVLTNALALSDMKRYEMGQNGRKLVEQKYTIESVTNNMIRLYKWILNSDSKPEFVI
jgi:glycosyltransferase involved in cell wall biosynthesis